MSEQHSILAGLVLVTPELGNLKKKDYYDLDVSLGYVVLGQYRLQNKTRFQSLPLKEKPKKGFPF